MESLLGDFREADCFVLGEGEDSTLKLIQCLNERKNWRNLGSLAYRYNEEVMMNEKPKMYDNLDEFPYPNRAFISKSHVVYANI
jgi:radical SAM superfamily enzyme YgiQ (UPF0313 family)